MREASKCCGVKVYYDYKQVDNFNPQPYIGLRYVPHCSKCRKPCKVEGKISVA